MVKKVKFRTAKVRHASLVSSAKRALKKRSKLRK